MDTLLITDVETGGLEAGKDPCLEVGLVVFDIPTLSVIETFSTLIHAKENGALSINRIPVDLLERGRLHSNAWQIVEKIVDRYGSNACFVAHRASFDRSFYPESIANRLPWACSKYDMAWPSSKYGDGLVHVALAHGIGILDAHRALTDCQTLARLFRRVGELGQDVSGMIDHALLPRKTYRALVSYADKDLAKELGFEWDGQRKIWHRRLLVDEAANEIKWPFKLEEVAA